jgi:ABC-type branched-subunit amino acid transport system ATPase component
MLRIVEADSYYEQSRVLHGLTLEVKPGEFVAILGRNGTGKTTALKTLMGLTDRHTGKIVFNDRDLSIFQLTSAPAPASPMCLKGVKSSPNSRSTKTF